MSSKSTILLSNANEHWYHDCFDDTFNLEIDPEHDCECDEEGMFITIKKETALYAAIEDLWRFGRNTKPKSPWIPVSERLPEHESDCDIFTKNRIRLTDCLFTRYADVAIFYHEHTDDLIALSDVLYWMKPVLPE